MYEVENCDIQLMLPDGVSPIKQKRKKNKQTKNNAIMNKYKLNTLNLYPNQQLLGTGLF